MSSIRRLQAGDKDKVFFECPMCLTRVQMNKRKLKRLLASGRGCCSKCEQRYTTATILEANPKLREFESKYIG